MSIELTFNDEYMWVQLANGHKFGIPLAYFPRLLKAAPQAREKYIIRGGDTGLHWDELDEDIYVPALLMGVGDRYSNR